MKCPICEFPMQRKGNQMYCSDDCRSVAKKMRTVNHSVAYVDRLKKQKALEELANKASKMGMSYGQFISKEDGR